MDKKSRVRAIPQSKYGVCVWEIKDDTGVYLSDGDNRYLSLEGKLGEIVVEEKMRKAAGHYLGDRVKEGRPVWLPAFRKISDMEHDDQMDRLLSGKIPDEIDQVKQALGKDKI